MNSNSSNTKGREYKKKPHYYSLWKPLTRDKYPTAPFGSEPVLPDWPLQLGTEVIQLLPPAQNHTTFTQWEGSPSLWERLPSPDPSNDMRYNRTILLGLSHASSWLLQS